MRGRGRRERSATTLIPYPLPGFLAGGHPLHLIVQHPCTEVARSSNVEILVDRVREPELWPGPRICDIPNTSHVLFWPQFFPPEK